MDIKSLFFGIISIALVYYSIILFWEITTNKTINKTMRKLCKHYEIMNKYQENLQECELKEFKRKRKRRYKHKEVNNG